MITKKELAISLNVHPNTIDRWIKNGMPVIKRERFIRFDYEDVLKWLKGDK